MHLVDVTMFFCGESGGVKRYLTAKRQWLARHPDIRHSLLVPGADEAADARNIVTRRTSEASRNTGAARGPRLDSRKESRAMQQGWGDYGFDPIGEGAELAESIYRLPGLPIPFSNGYRFPLRARRAAERLQRLEPDIIEAGDPYTLAWSALRAGRELGVPVVGFYHSDLPRLIRARFGIQGARLAETYVARLYARFSLVLAPSHAMVRELHALGITAARHQPLGVDTTLFRPHGQVIDLRAELGLAANTRLLAYAGRFAREKNIPWLFDALRRLGPPYHLIVIGGGSELTPPANVTILPYVSDSSRLARLLGSCDAFVHAGDKETFGLAVLEAMACGIPVVGMAAGGVAELVPPGAGVLVEPGGGAAIADGVDFLFAADPRAMGERACRYVSSHYAWEQVFPALLTHYRNLRSEHGAAGEAAAAPLQVAHAGE